MGLNRYRIKKKIVNFPYRLKREILSSEVKFSNKDLAWKESRNNPFHHGRNKFNFKKNIKVIILFVLLLGNGGILFFNSFFSIDQNITVDGLQKIEKIKIVETIQGMTSYRKFYIFPAKNYFILDIDLIKDVIKERFPVEKIIVKKSFPNNLNIIVEEKIVNIIYDNGKQYAFLSPDGKAIEILKKVGDNEWKIITKISTSTNEKGEEIKKEEIIEKNNFPAVKDINKEYGEYPVLFDNREKEYILNEKVLKEEIVSGAIKWYTNLNKKTDIPFSYIKINDELGNGIIKTKEGWELKVKIAKDTEEQFMQLQTLIKEKKLDRNKLQYVDLRFKEKIYWQ